MRILRLRFLEMFGWCIGLSVIATALTYSGIVPDTTQSVGLVMFCGFLIFLVVQTLELRGCFFVLEHKFEYFLANITIFVLLAFAVFATRPVLNLFGGLFGVSGAGNIVHTWMFGIFKFAMFSSEETGWIVSCIISMVLVAADILLSPLGMKNYLIFNVHKE